MRKYIIEVSETCMDSLKMIKQDQALTSISKVVEYLADRFPEMEKQIIRDKEEIFILRNQVIELALKV